jgi:hypothetical protein
MAYAGQMGFAPAVQAAGTYGSPAGHRGGYEGNPHPYSKTEVV